MYKFKFSIRFKDLSTSLYGFTITYVIAGTIREAEGKIHRFAQINGYSIPLDEKEGCKNINLMEVEELEGDGWTKAMMDKRGEDLENLIEKERKEK